MAPVFHALDVKWLGQEEPVRTDLDDQVQWKKQGVRRRYFKGDRLVEGYKALVGKKWRVFSSWLRTENFLMERRNRLTALIS